VPLTSAYNHRPCCRGGESEGRREHRSSRPGPSSATSRVWLGYKKGEALEFCDLRLQNQQQQLSAAVLLYFFLPYMRRRIRSLFVPVAERWRLLRSLFLGERHRSPRRLFAYGIPQPTSRSWSALALSFLCSRQISSARLSMRRRAASRYSVCESNAESIGKRQWLTAGKIFLRGS
jgi:hypothetical protein